MTYPPEKLNSISRDKRKPSLSRRREVTAIVALAAAGVLFSKATEASGKPRLFAFVPSVQKSHTIQKAFQSALPTLDVTVFGKSRDFEKAASSQNPAAILAPEPLLKTMGARVALQGTRSGSVDETYVLITVDHALAPPAMSAHTVGAFGIMGRRDMKKFCGRLLGTASQRIKTVTKYADLLPLLQFQVAKGVVLPKRLSSIVTERSELKLITATLPDSKVGLVALSVNDAKFEHQIVSALRQIDQTSRSYMGVDGWR